jgi:hypothetical protein
MPKFSKGDRVRLIPNILPPILGAQHHAVCTVVRSGVYFGRGPEGEIDVQLPDGMIVRSLPAARFEEVTQVDTPAGPQALNAGLDGGSAGFPPMISRAP